MFNMCALLSSLNSRIEGFERRQDHLEDTAASYTVDSALQGPSTGQIPGVQAAPPILLTAEKCAPLPDVVDEV